MCTVAHFIKQDLATMLALANVTVGVAGLFTPTEFLFNTGLKLKMLKSREVRNAHALYGEV